MKVAFIVLLCLFGTVCADTMVDIEFSELLAGFDVGGGCCTEKIMNGLGKYNGNMFVVHLQDDNSPYSYVDEYGMATGFDMMIVKASVEAAGYGVNFVVGPAEECMNSDMTMGEGLKSKWYDACTGFEASHSNMLRVGFTNSYASAPGAYFFVRDGEEDTYMTDTGIAEGTNVGVTTGSSANSGCLMRAGYETEYNVAEYDDVFAMLNDGTVDVAFSYDEPEDMTGITMLDTATECSAGHAVAQRFDSTFGDVFNSGLEMIMMDGTDSDGVGSLYNEICAAYEIENCM
jgi:hypothetical protein